MKAVVNTKIILPHGLVWDGVVLFENGRITGFGEKDSVAVPGGAELIDAHGGYTGPGFVDIHNHGGGGHWFYDDPVRAAEHFLLHGETTVLPTLYTNLSLEEYLSSFSKIRAAMANGAGRIIAGVNMEGPYLNPKYGSDAKTTDGRAP
jgi:N-acetylglucosamine-6-phosphate deacetylase